MDGCSSVSAIRGVNAVQQTAFSFDHLVGAYHQGQRHLDAERLGRLEIDHQLEAC
jgi:hypothetical protein